MSNVTGTNYFTIFLQNVDVANPRYSQYRIDMYTSIETSMFRTNLNTGHV